MNKEVKLTLRPKSSRKKTKPTKNKVSTSNKDPEKITPVGDAAPDADSKEIHVGGNYLYYEGITWKTFRNKYYLNKYRFIKNSSIGYFIKKFNLDLYD